MNEFFEDNGENKNNVPQNGEHSLNHNLDPDLNSNLNPDLNPNSNPEFNAQQNNMEFSSEQNAEPNPQTPPQSAEPNPQMWQNAESNPQNPQQGAEPNQNPQMWQNADPNFQNPEQPPKSFYPQNNYQDWQQPPKVDPYGGNMNYQWNYDDYAKAVTKPKKNKGMKIFVISLCSVFGLALILLIGVGINAVIKDGLPGLSNTSSSTTSDTVINPNGPSLAIQPKPAGGNAQVTTTGELTTPQVVKAISPAIVGVENFTLQSGSSTPAGEGSGIILSSDGYIVTNEHVIDGADTVKVVLSNSKEVVAKVVGSDTLTDIAVLKIDGTGYPVASLGDSNALEVGDSVIAIGNPGGMEFSDTVTAGIVSAVNRSLGTGNFIQTDAAINPGNSGGALVNMYGQVVGITSQKIPTISDISAEGMGFAIPIVEVKSIVDTLIKYGYVKGRVTLGVTSCQDADQSIAQANGVPVSVWVLEVDPTSNAAKAGLQRNDFITQINGVTVQTTDELITQRDKYKPGDTVTLTVYRYSTQQTLKIKFVLTEDKGTTTTASSSPDPIDPNQQDPFAQN